MSCIQTNILAGASGQGATGYKIERSLRFNSADTSYLNFQPSSAGNRKTWTFSTWVKKVSSDSLVNIIFGSYTDGSNRLYLAFQGGTDKILLYCRIGGTDIVEITTDAVFRDFSAWMHLVVSIDSTASASADRVKIYINGTQQSLTTAVALGQNVDTYINATAPHYIGFLSGASYLNGYLADIHFVDGQALAPTDFGETDGNGVWQPIAYSGSYGTNGFHLPFTDNSSNAALGTDSSGNSNTWTVNNLIAAASTVPSYTVTNSSTAANAFDGSFSTVWSANSGTQSLLTFASAIAGTTFRFYIGSSLNTTGFQINGTTPTNWTGANADGWVDFSSHINGSLSSIRVAFTPNQYKQSLFAIEIDGTVLVDYSSPNIDSLVDTPTNGTQVDTGAGAEVSGNYATLNPADKGGDSSATVTDGNLKWFGGTTTYHAISRSTIGVSSGKWYVEVTIDDASDTSGRDRVGIVSSSENISISNPVLGNLATGYGYRSDGYKENNSSNSSYGASYTTEDVIGISLDMDAGSLVFYKNGSSQGTAYTGITGTMHFCGTPRENGTYIFNFGQRAFAYTAPSSYKSLNTVNLPDPTIADGSQYFDTKLWTGITDSSTPNQTITGYNFSPDFVMVKCRSHSSNHGVFDIVRGAENMLHSDTTDSVDTLSTNTLKSFNSDGFTLNDPTWGGLSYTGRSFAGWAWDAGSSTLTNNDGSIASQVRANPSAGFSILTATTVTSGSSFSVGHGLGAAPAFAIFKDIDNANNWGIYHQSVTTTSGGVLLFTSAAAQNYSWFPSAPTSTTFTLSVGGWGTGGDVVGYLWSPVEGYSAFGSYTGNGSATDGPFVYTGGFRPAFVLWKRTDALDNWSIIDSSRSPYNVADDWLGPNSSSNESSNNPAYAIDLCSNGFKIRATHAATNASGGSYIYAAFAENPFKTARAR